MSRAKTLPILMYHHVSPTPGLVTVTPAHFAAQMAWLAEQGYHTASTRDLENFLAGKPLPKKSVMLTFDDGYRDNYVFAYPVLKQYGLRATLFVVTDWLGEGAVRPILPVPPVPPAASFVEEELSWPSHRQCQQAIQQGDRDAVIIRWSEALHMQQSQVFELHSHTASHIRWDQRAVSVQEKSAQIAADVQRASEALCHRCGYTVAAHVCWPQGYFDADYLAAAKASGIAYCYTTRPGVVYPDTPANALPRIVVKDRAAGWLARRLYIYRSPLLSRLYCLSKRA